ncbi:MAG TPA: AAA family ATPase [Saprospiraceae bacterium]|nr:AAA family ATPase [Saprospiraceae bacterium]HMQ81969.1 AAA family ATPase [Saprospiraceae bacterium]
MQVLHYNELDYKGLKSKVNKVEKMLAQGGFKSAEVKKMQNAGYYRAKLDYENRLLFQFAKHKEETYILLLEVITNHEYEKSRFLRGAIVKEQHFVEIAVPEVQVQLKYVNPQGKRFHLLDKFISLDADQEEIYDLPTPLIIIGSAGSGKTALTLEKMKNYRGHVAYLSLSPFLVENSQRIYEANSYENENQDVDFLSFSTYLQSIYIPQGKELDYRTFERWYERGLRQRFKFKDTYKLFEEFKGVLTGSVTDAPYLTRQRYIELGVKQSIFLKEERSSVYDLFEKYLDFLKEQTYYDSNIIAYQYLEKVSPKYDFIVIDEVQDITNIQLLLILKALKTPGNFILSGDSNQIVHPNFFSWSKIKSLFFQEDLQGSALRILKTNYRNSWNVTRLSNDLLKIKNARFGSIDKESTYLIQTVAEAKGEIFFFEDDDKVKKELNKRTEGSAKFAILVMDKAHKAQVGQYFKTPLIFTVQEAKGLEYDNIILINFISEYDNQFREIAAGVTLEDLQDEHFRYARARDKTDKEQEVYKFYINSLYVAFTRAVQNLYLIEAATKNDLLKLLQVTNVSQAINIEIQKSDETEWLKEADRLEAQGKIEQAEAIRARLKGIEYISNEEAEILVEKIFGQTPEFDNADLDRLFRYAKNRFRIDLIFSLQAEKKYGPAKQYLGEYQKGQQQLANYIKNNNRKGVEQIIAKFGVNIPVNEEKSTGLMLAAQFGKIDLLYFFIDQKAALNQQDAFGRNALQHLLLGYDQRKISKKFLQSWYPKLAPPGAQCRYENRLYIINHKSMEFFLINLLNALRMEIFSFDDPIAEQGMRMDDFMEYVEDLPPGILAEYRTKRQYVNSILSKNELDRNDPYNKKLFIRRSKGCYDFLPGAVITWS